MTERTKPDFICIGPEKTGTSWLYAQLLEHPRVYLPSVKELRYWNEGNLVPAHSRLRVLFDDHWHFKHLRKFFWSCVKECWSKRAMKIQHWSTFYASMQYVWGTRNDDWYEALFNKIPSKLSGDISPLYYHLEEAQVEKISKYRPATKIIILVRDPIARTWSKVRMNVLRHKRQSFEETCPQEFLDHFSEIKSYWRPYSETVALWKKHFKNVYVGYYDEILQSPYSIYSDICAFLGLEPTASQERLDRKINKGLSIDIPQQLLARLRTDYGGEILSMTEQTESPHPQTWKELYGL